MSLHSRHSGQHGLTRGILALEIVSIMLAVALGFLVTEWREGLADSRRSRAALNAIKAEISMNREHLGDRVPYYAHLVSELNELAAIDGEAQFTGGELDGWRGLNPPFLHQAAYEAASATGALSHMDFDVVSRVAEAYLAQEMVDSTFDWALQSALTGQLETRSDAQRAFYLMLEASQLAVGTYDSVLQSLGSKMTGDETE
ncbi:MAG: hypothetical protein GF405_03040 [Candidatus Eisenbacteria bacterium]|nr:hypothetical protein [Candidatus Eisenbacteria bacterium]